VYIDPLACKDPRPSNSYARIPSFEIFDCVERFRWMVARFSRYRDRDKADWLIFIANTYRRG
jgi:hypothetical protein